MMTQDYILTIDTQGCQACYKVSYRGNRFFRLERKNGRLDARHHQRLMTVIPDDEDGIASLSEIYKSKIRYEKVVKQTSVYASFVGVYLGFYCDKTGLEYSFSPTSGKAMKTIIAVLSKLTGNQTKALALWRVMLSNWSKIEPFYAKQIEVRQIASNINIILRQIKNGHGQNTSQQAQSNADRARHRL